MFLALRRFDEIQWVGRQELADARVVVSYAHANQSEIAIVTLLDVLQSGGGCGVRTSLTVRGGDVLCSVRITHDTAHAIEWQEFECFTADHADNVLADRKSLCQAGFV